MQTNISVEEFSRYQAQLLELRQQTYTANEARIKAEKLVKQIEDTLAAQSGELAELRSQLSRVQRAGDIDTVVRENHALRQKLINIESSFQLQTTTLRGECERLQNDKEVLLSTLKLAGCIAPPKDDATLEAYSQTETPGFTSLACQTNLLPIMLSSLAQTDISSPDILVLYARLEHFPKMEAELDNIRQSLVEEKMRSGEQYDELTERLDTKEAEIIGLQEENEALRSELITLQRRSDKMQREMRRQLASAMRKTDSSSSLVFINSSLDGGFSQHQQTANILPDSDTTSNCSFSICPPRCATSGSGNTSYVPEPGVMSETSSNKSSNLAVGTLFSEEDFRSLLNRLSEVQEENCTLRRHLKYISTELDAKSLIIQQRLDEKMMPVPLLTLPPKPAQISSSDTASSSLLANALAGIKSKWKLLESPVSASGVVVSASSELRSLKQLCEELMTRNIFLEQALEETLTRARKAEAILA